MFALSSVVNEKYIDCTRCPLLLLKMKGFLIQIGEKEEGFNVILVFIYPINDFFEHNLFLRT